MKVSELNLSILNAFLENTEVLTLDDFNGEYISSTEATKTLAHFGISRETIAEELQSFANFVSEHPNAEVPSKESFLVDALFTQLAARSPLFDEDDKSLKKTKIDAIAPGVLLQLDEVYEVDSSFTPAGAILYYVTIEATDDFEDPLLTRSSLTVNLINMLGPDKLIPVLKERLGDIFEPQNIELTGVEGGGTATFSFEGAQVADVNGDRLYLRPIPDNATPVAMVLPGTLGSTIGLAFSEGMQIVYGNGDSGLGGAGVSLDFEPEIVDLEDVSKFISFSGETLPRLAGAAVVSLKDHVKDMVLEDSGFENISGFLVTYMYEIVKMTYESYAKDPSSLGHQLYPRGMFDIANRIPEILNVFDLVGFPYYDANDLAELAYYILAPWEDGINIPETLAAVAQQFKHNNCGNLDVETFVGAVCSSIQDTTIETGLRNLCLRSPSDISNGISQYGIGYMLATAGGKSVEFGSNEALRKFRNYAIEVEFSDILSSAWGDEGDEGFLTEQQIRDLLPEEQIESALKQNAKEAINNRNSVVGGGDGRSTGTKVNRKKTKSYTGRAVAGAIFGALLLYGAHRVTANKPLNPFR